MKFPFHMKGWAPRLALRKRLKVIRNFIIIELVLDELHTHMPLTWKDEKEGVPGI